MNIFFSNQAEIDLVNKLKFKIENLLKKLLSFILACYLPLATNIIKDKLSNYYSKNLFNDG